MSSDSEHPHDIGAEGNKTDSLKRVRLFRER
jgi:hypothetical protein